MNDNNEALTKIISILSNVDETVEGLLVKHGERLAGYEDAYRMGFAIGVARSALTNAGIVTPYDSVVR